MSGSHIVVVLTNTKGDVERHRVCDKHIIEVAEPSPAVTVVNLSTRGLMSIVVVVNPQYTGGLWLAPDDGVSTGTNN